MILTAAAHRSLPSNDLSSTRNPPGFGCRQSARPGKMTATVMIVITEQRTTVRPTDNEPEPGVLGRAAELRRLGVLVDGGALGSSAGVGPSASPSTGAGPNVLVLTGEPGVGKSTLVEWTA